MGLKGRLLSALCPSTVRIRTAFTQSQLMMLTSSTFRQSLTSDAGANFVIEHASIGTFVGIAAFASDNDATTNQISYLLDDSAGGRFAIDALTGVVSVANGATIDFESTPSLNDRGSGCEQ